MGDDEKRTRSAKWKNAQGQNARRRIKERVKTARGRKLSSTRWLERQLNDPYVTAAQEEGYRSRAAFKLIEIDDKFRFLKPGQKVVDLGAAPGGWCQVAAQRIAPRGSAPTDPDQILAVDLQEMEPITGVTIVQMDFMDDTAPDQIRALLSGPVDVVLSDMAAAATGHKQTDHMRIIALCEAALDFAYDVLSDGGVFVAKVLRGGTEHELLASMKSRFKSVKHFKPDASRSDSAEIYVVATGFRQAQKAD